MWCAAWLRATLADLGAGRKFHALRAGATCLCLALQVYTVWPALNYPWPVQVQVGCMALSAIKAAAGSAGHHLFDPLQTSAVMSCHVEIVFPDMQHVCRPQSAARQLAMPPASAPARPAVQGSCIAPGSRPVSAGPDALRRLRHNTRGLDSRAGSCAFRRHPVPDQLLVGGLSPTRTSAWAMFSRLSCQA